MGPLVSAEQRARVMDFVRLAREQGARLVTGGGTPDHPMLSGGYYVEPTVFVDVTMDMRVAREEIFGPVLSILRWSDEDTVVREANMLDYGLTASIFTQDLDAAHRLAGRMEAGYVWINQVGYHFLGAPFGGTKHSGLGREECLDELLACTQVKNVNIKFLSA
jgi:betaine-aldehyde dehydrogenase